MYLAVVVTDVLLWILILAGAFALIALGLVFIGAFKSLSKINEVLDENKRALGETLYRLPNVIDNVDDITASLADLVDELSPEVNKTMENVADVTGSISNISRNIEPDISNIVTNISNISDNAASMANTAEEATNAVKGGVESVAQGFKNFGKKTRDAADTVANVANAWGKNAKANILEKKRDTLGGLLSAIEKLRDILGL